MLDPIAALSFSVFENKGIYAALLGSGLSRSAQILTGWEITLDLIRRVGLLEDVPEQADWVAWHRTRFNKEPQYSDLLNMLAPTADERRAILHRYIEATPEDIQRSRRVPTKAHRAIAQLVKDGFIRVIVTTNFDRLLDNAIRDAGVEPTVIKSEDDLRGAVPLAHSRCYLVKLHGDYLDTRILNTEAELANYHPVFEQLLDRILDEYGLIVSGWSGEWDIALRSAIVRAANRRYPFFWTVRGAPNATAEELVQHRAGRFIQITDADAFWTRLADKVALQMSLQKEDPRSINLLIAATKKYLAGPQYRIELTDLVWEELKRALELVTAENFQMGGPWSNEEFVRRIGRYEAIFEPLTKIVAVVGRWGGDDEFEITREVVSNLANQEIGGGFTDFVALRAYPAMLLTYAYGLGTLRAGHLSRLHSVFHIPVSDINANQSTFVSDLFLGAWAADKRELWNLLSEFGGQNRKTPLSDHLHSLFQEWLGAELFLPREFTAAFEEFELLERIPVI